MSRARQSAGLLVACALLAACSGAAEVPSGGAAATPTGGDASATLAPGDHAFRVTVDGRTRRYQLHVPTIGPVEPRPLMIELHGGGGRAAQLERLTGLTAVTDARGWLVAAPDGVDRQWNDGRSEVGSGVDDVAFLRALVDDVARRTSIDRGRVFATGISNGAMMSGRLACDASDVVVAVAQVAGTLGQAAETACAPARPVSVLVIAGTDDRLVPYRGGEVGPRLGRSRGTVVGAEGYVAGWVDRDGLADVEPTTTDLPPDTTVTAYIGPDPGPRVVLMRVEGAGHTWPGGTQYLPELIVGSTSQTFSASEAIVEFFVDATR